MIYKKGAYGAEIRENMRGGDGAVSLTPLAEGLPAKMRLFSEIRLEAGSSIGYHVHENETELFYFIEGSGTVMDDDKASKVSAGDAMVTPSGHGHSVKNDGEGVLRLVAVIITD